MLEWAYDNLPSEIKDGFEKFKMSGATYNIEDEDEDDSSVATLTSIERLKSQYPYENQSGYDSFEGDRDSDHESEIISD